MTIITYSKEEFDNKIQELEDDPEVEEYEVEFHDYSPAGLGALTASFNTHQRFASIFVTLISHEAS